MEKKELVQLLALENFDPVYEQADAVRQEKVGDVVHVRRYFFHNHICTAGERIFLFLLVDYPQSRRNRQIGLRQQKPG